MTMAPETRLGDFTEQLGSSAPAPGGGAASALVGALAAALAEMVGQLTVGRPRFQAVEDRVQHVVEQLRRARGELLGLIDVDAAAFLHVSGAYKLPRATDGDKATRDAAIQVALREAMRPPLRVMEIACDVLLLADEVALIGNPSVASDAGCSALLGEAAARAAALNVLANVVLLRESQEAQIARTTVAALEKRAATLREKTLATVRERMERVSSLPAGETPP
ncbi:MAG TPA: cyclodeaminase/cyclohydrolase family protein [Ktedonobacterales bacterium]|jgi:formiminotetrahydrofolate cyclodeaminase|nr:cyclodeaminase/cyclohydrolase family protein [Ktedonobacterales bacterium]